MNKPARAFSPADLMARAFNTPLMISAEKAQVIMGVIGPRLDVTTLIDACAGSSAEHLGIEDLVERAATARHEIETAADGTQQLAPKAGGHGQTADGREFYRAYSVIQGVAVIPVRGTLVSNGGLHPSSGMTSWNGLLAKLNMAMEDVGVKGIAFDIDSGGGECAQCFDFTNAASAETTGADMDVPDNLPYCPSKRVL